jgi:hypothetical protein
MSSTDEDFEFDVPYDPFAVDDGFAEDDEDVAFIGLIEEPLDGEKPPEDTPELAPEERIQHLLDSIPAQRKVMLGIIDFCRSPRSPAAVDAFTNELQRLSPSIYTPVILRQHLQAAGALDYLEQAQEADAQDGEANSALTNTNASLIPNLGNSDEELPQIEYLEVTKRPEGSWASTAAGLTICDRIDYLADLRKVIEEEPEYTEIFVRILRYCSETPRTKHQLNELVDDDPLLAGPPRVYSGHFTGVLDECGGLEWCPGWGTSEVGRAFLEEYDRAKARESLEPQSERSTS